MMSLTADAPLPEAIVPPRPFVRGRPRNRLIFELLHGVRGDDEDAFSEARAFGIDLAQPRAVMLIDAGDYTFKTLPEIDQHPAAGGVAARANRIVRSIVEFFELPHDTICSDLGDGEIAVLKASNTRNLVGWSLAEDDAPLAGRSWANLAALKRAANDLLERLVAETGATLTIGIGRHHRGISGLAASYVDARVAMTLGRRLHGPNRVHCLDDLGIAAFVAVNDELMKIDLAHHLLSPLDQEAELLETLDAFFEVDCSPAAAARQLRIHRNTLGYRLAKIASLTGLDPRRFDDAVQIRLARVLRGLGPLGNEPFRPSPSPNSTPGQAYGNRRRARSDVQPQDGAGGGIDQPLRTDL
jgi:carbohydrate diacid regulator